MVTIWWDLIGYVYVAKKTVKELLNMTTNPNFVIKPGSIFLQNGQGLRTRTDTPFFINGGSISFL